MKRMGRMPQMLQRDPPCLPLPTLRVVDTLPLCAQIGVPEVWRYDGVRLEMPALHEA